MRDPNPCREDAHDHEEDDISVTSSVSSEPADEYVVESILTESTAIGSTSPRYLVKWEGYPLDRSTWEPRESFPEETLLHDWEEQKAQIAQGLALPFELQDFHDAVAAAELARDQRKLRREAKRSALGLLDTLDGVVDEREPRVSAPRHRRHSSHADDQPNREVRPPTSATTAQSPKKHPGQARTGAADGRRASTGTTKVPGDEGSTTKPSQRTGAAKTPAAVEKTDRMRETATGPPQGGVVPKNVGSRSNVSHQRPHPARRSPILPPARMGPPGARRSGIMGAIGRGPSRVVKPPSKLRTRRLSSNPSSAGPFFKTLAEMRRYELKGREEPAPDLTQLALFTMDGRRVKDVGSKAASKRPTESMKVAPGPGRLAKQPATRAEEEAKSPTSLGHAGEVSTHPVASAEIIHAPRPTLQVVTGQNNQVPSPASEVQPIKKTISLATYLERHKSGFVSQPSTPTHPQRELSTHETKMGIPSDVTYGMHILVGEEELDVGRIVMQPKVDHPIVAKFDARFKEGDRVYLKDPQMARYVNLSHSDEWPDLAADGKVKSQNLRTDMVLSDKVDALALSLGLNDAVAVLRDPDFTLLIYPRKMKDFQHPGDEFVRVDEDVRFYWQLRGPSTDTTRPTWSWSSMNQSVLSSNNTLVQAYRGARSTQYESLLSVPSSESERTDNFIIMCPWELSNEEEVYREYLWERGANSVVSHEDVSLTAFAREHDAGVVLVHPSFHRFHLQIGFRHALAKKKIKILEFGVRTEAVPRGLDVTDEKDYLGFHCNLLLPSGGMVLITPNLVLEDPVTARDIVRWLRVVLREQGPQSWKVYGRPNLAAWALHVATEHSADPPALLEARVNFVALVGEYMCEPGNTSPLLDHENRMVPTEESPIQWDNSDLEIRDNSMDDNDWMMNIFPQLCLLHVRYRRHFIIVDPTPPARLPYNDNLVEYFTPTQFWERFRREAVGELGPVTAAALVEPSPAPTSG
ncbi:MAG: hypothetical protein M1838_000030 [Thelocarpon superellum]|nr:MAG: hypothetical protein M1838_000030 [Thelocarpon superellum]